MFYFLAILLMYAILAVLRDEEHPVTWRVTIAGTLAVWVPVFIAVACSEAIVPNRPVNAFPAELLIAFVAGGYLLCLVLSRVFDWTINRAITASILYAAIFVVALIFLWGLFRNMH